MITKISATTLFVRPVPGHPQHGRLSFGTLCLPCALGRSGITHDKREGDGATPAGRFALRRLWYRADRHARPRTGLPLRPIREQDGWCDAVSHRRYNRAVAVPFAQSHERMWRDDAVYDFVIEIGWNDRPVRKGRGSAIFLHLARPGHTPTEGCVAINRSAMLKLLCHLNARTRICIS